MKYRWIIPDGFSERLNEAIKVRGMTGEQVAWEIDIVPTSMYSYLHGRTCMNIGRLHEICTVLDVSADWLLFGTGSIERQK